MGSYRVHLLDHPDEHIVKTHMLRAQDDYAAYHEASQYLDGHDIEILGCLTVWWPRYLAKSRVVPTPPRG